MRGVQNHWAWLGDYLISSWLTKSLLLLVETGGPVEDDGDWSVRKCAGNVRCFGPREEEPLAI